jgi:hypothetical protein
MLHVPPIVALSTVTLAPFVLAEGARLSRAAMGMWAAYAPRTRLKVLHAVGGHVHSIARSAPAREQVGTDRDPDGVWQRAFSTPVTRRVAENWIMLERLHRAGIGPEPLALAVVPRYRSWFTRGTTWSAGYYVANLHDYPPKAPTTEEELRAAGIIPSARRSCLREQINGYVSDLNSARGAMPENAEEEVAALTARLDAALAEARGAR